MVLNFYSSMVKFLLNYIFLFTNYATQKRLCQLFLLHMPPLPVTGFVIKKELQKSLIIFLLVISMVIHVSFYLLKTNIYYFSISLELEGIFKAGIGVTQDLKLSYMKNYVSLRINTKFACSYQHAHFVTD